MSAFFFGLSLLSLFEGQFQILPRKLPRFPNRHVLKRPWTLSSGFVSFPFLFLNFAGRFPGLGTVDISDRLNSLLWCTVLCIVEHLAASLPSIR